MKITLIIAALLLVVAGGYYVSIARAGMSEEEVLARSRSIRFDSKLKKFVNMDQASMDKQFQEMSIVGALTRLFTNDNETSPNKKLPTVKTDFDAFMMPQSGARAVWFGHSTFLLRLDDTNILVDPVFGDSVSPVPFTAPRFQEAPAKLSDLPKIDYILISHDHYDHLEKASMQFFADKGVMYLVPIGNKKRLMDWGVPESKIREMDWWETYIGDKVEFVFAPAQHSSGRGVFDQFHTLWGSWVIIGTEERYYFSGDTGYADHFKSIGDKYGPFAAAFVESGQYNKDWSTVHLLPEQWGKVNRELRAESYIPVHWGMFTLAYHNWYDPPEYLTEHSAKEGINLRIPRIGQIIHFDSAIESDPWWRDAL